ncbi:MAG: hypothetical protein HFI05_00170 [Lachnospiraceae bacterium]|jgi:hypothetical protein|nr:hypothetical protein [Lachnospiraceae bacterium]
MDGFYSVGAIITDMGDITELIAKESGDGAYDLYYNNDPYGIINFYGFRDLRFKPIETECTIAVNEGSVLKNNSEEYIYAVEALKRKLRGEAVGIAFLEDGFLIIKDAEYFTAVIQPIRLGEREEIEYKQFIDVSEVDDMSSDLEELCDIFNLC